ncbi:MAG: hypothetical protein JO185_09790 [Acidobacteriaceae bacterium]|nr:hypothetical protein [Acidobacteriaceae bacterium]
MPVSLTIDQYRDAKTTYEKLRNQAKKELITRYQELANELLLVQQELREDFGHKVTMPTKARNGHVKKTAPPAKAETAVAPSSPKITAIEKKLIAQKKKLADAQAANKPLKTIEDRIYELEDELRLAGGYTAA